AAIVAEGADLVELDLSYDDVVAHVAARAGGDALLIQDTSWSGYEEEPQWSVDGYATLLAEVDEQVADRGFERPDMAVLPGGAVTDPTWWWCRRGWGRWPRPWWSATAPLTTVPR